MEKSLNESESKDFLNDILDVQNSETKREITRKFQEIKSLLEKIANLKNMVDEKNLRIVLINQNISKLQIKADALKKEVAEDAKEIEKPEA